MNCIKTECYVFGAEYGSGWNRVSPYIYIFLIGSELIKSQTSNPLAYVLGTGITGMCHQSKYMKSASNTNNFDKSKEDKKVSNLYLSLN